MKARFFIFFIVLAGLMSCSKSPSPEKLPETVRENFKLIQKNPQFIMYVNFNDMRKTNFWKIVINDSIIKAESEFGGILEVFKKSTGASVSEGLDEFILANSWDEKNTIILRGTFNKDKLNEYIKTDSSYMTISSQNGTLVYVQKDKNLYFYLKDNSLICASNYLSRIEETLSVTDTTKSTLNDNPDMIKIIDNTLYKNSIWLVTNQKTFIRGLLLNFSLGSETTGTDSINITDSSYTTPQDTTIQVNKNYFENVYQNINSFSLSTRMSNDLQVAIQFEFTDEMKAEEFTKVLNGMIALSKLTAGAIQKDNPVQKVLDNIEIITSYNYSFLKAKITTDNINEFRMLNLMQKPQ
jgi:hypothetical protein